MRLIPTLLLAGCGAGPLADVSTQELCGTGDASVDVSPAPWRVRGSGDEVPLSATAAAAGAHPEGAWADLIEDLGLTESPQGGLKVRFEGPAALDEARRRCTVSLPAGSDAHLLAVRAARSGVEAVIAGTASGQARALATLRQLPRGGRIPRVSIFDAPRVPMRLVLEGAHRSLHNRMHEQGHFHEHTPAEDHAEHGNARGRR